MRSCLWGAGHRAWHTVGVEIKVKSPACFLFLCTKVQVLSSPLPLKEWCILELILTWSPLVAQALRKLPAKQETQVQSLDWEDPLDKGNGNPLQYSFLENPMDRGAWLATVYGTTKSWTWLSNTHTHTYTHTHTHTYTHTLFSPDSPLEP